MCTGYGGLDLGVLAAFGGGRVTWCADNDPHVTTLLDARMPSAPNLGDLRTVDWSAVPTVDIVTAGFPCQDISAAGRRAGIKKGQRSGLWTSIVAALRLLHPQLVVVENVAALRWRNGGLDRVLADLAAAGYDALWRSVRAADVGAPHRRERVFLLGWPRRLEDQDVRNADSTRWQLQRCERRQQTGWAVAAGPVAVVADANRTGPACDCTPGADQHRSTRPRGQRWIPSTAVPGGPAAGGRADVVDSACQRRRERLPATTGFQGRVDAVLSGGSPAPSTATHNDTWNPPATEVDWGDYATAIARWEATLGRPAPFPTQPGRHGRPVLAPPLVEHIMGLPRGWVTDLALSRTAQLKVLGNGVVPQQATRAVSLLLADLQEFVRHASSAEDVS
ncbi:DNA cytosine methyltransferase [Lentzea albidocapillata]|nr:DNA cytosine methyltransferase [Lentzea albidocapillata]